MKRFPYRRYMSSCPTSLDCENIYSSSVYFVQNLTLNKSSGRSSDCHEAGATSQCVNLGVSNWACSKSNTYCDAKTKGSGNPPCSKCTLNAGIDKWYWCSCLSTSSYMSTNSTGAAIGNVTVFTDSVTDSTNTSYVVFVVKYVSGNIANATDLQTFYNYYIQNIPTWFATNSVNGVNIVTSNTTYYNCLQRLVCCNNTNSSSTACQEYVSECVSSIDNTCTGPYTYCNTGCDTSTNCTSMTTGVCEKLCFDGGKPNSSCQVSNFCTNTSNFATTNCVNAYQDGMLWDSLTTNCARNTGESSTDYINRIAADPVKSTVCGCFLDQTAYDDYYQSLADKLNIPVASILKLNSCFFPLCTNSDVQKTQVTCPSQSITSCISEINATGSTVGNVAQSNSCAAQLTNSLTGADGTGTTASQPGSTTTSPVLSSTAPSPTATTTTSNTKRNLLIALGVTVGVTLLTFLIVLLIKKHAMSSLFSLIHKK